MNPDACCLSPVRPSAAALAVYYSALALFIPLLVMSIAACVRDKGGKTPLPILWNLFLCAALFLAGVSGAASLFVDSVCALYNPGAANPLTQIAVLNVKIRITLFFGFSLVYLLMFAVFYTVHRLRGRKGGI